ncbi:hypothetical protein B0H11DRAFT_2251422 [Mycena galericulata]|nr:hypothetical protein B0H11DRAFT_2251422 [Mycena galericulata]
MYSTIDPEYLLASIFLNLHHLYRCAQFRLINLFVAVIIFGAIRAQTKRSVFSVWAGQASLPWRTLMTTARLRPPQAPLPRQHVNPTAFLVKHWQTCWLFIALALQVKRTPEITAYQERNFNYAELSITALFNLEILLRAAPVLPDWGAVVGKEGAEVGAGVGEIGSIWGSSDPGPYRSALVGLLLVHHLLVDVVLARILVVPQMIGASPCFICTTLLNTASQFAVFKNMYSLVNVMLYLIIVNFIAALVATTVRSTFSSRVAALNMLNLNLEHLGVDMPPNAKEGLARVVTACSQSPSIQLEAASELSPAEKAAIMVHAHREVIGGLPTCLYVPLDIKAELLLL